MVINIKNLRKSFGEKEVLKGIDMEVRKGEIIGYIGPNGAGKSTTVKIILGLIRDFEGDINILGYDIRDNDISYKSKIGYVPEIADMYESLSAREYLTFIGELYGINRDDADAKASRLMDLFSIGDAYDLRIGSFSKGMKQKTMIISALLNDPEILFLDEPLTGMDASSVMVFKEVIDLLSKEGKTIFYSSHIMDVVEKLSSRIILINDGEIVADGTIDELKRGIMENSLEDIFNELTGFYEHESVASEIVSVVKGVK